ncbi:hypothetical protein GGR50DRAFT_491898 [Xylaria sp. CBS 124048]|nr:hypothetical protein GGR50DRAFT_491898 [Xylaria sp. CBS 124048]
MHSSAIFLPVLAFAGPALVATHTTPTQISCSIPFPKAKETISAGRNYHIEWKCNENSTSKAYVSLWAGDDANTSNLDEFSVAVVVLSKKSYDWSVLDFCLGDKAFYRFMLSGDPEGRERFGESHPFHIKAGSSKCQATSGYSFPSSRSSQPTDSEKESATLTVLHSSKTTSSHHSSAKETSPHHSATKTTSSHPSSTKKTTSTQHGSAQETTLTSWVAYTVSVISIVPTSSTSSVSETSVTPSPSGGATRAEAVGLGLGLGLGILMNVFLL